MTVTPVKGEVQKRGERRGEAVEKRPDGEAERDAARADGDEPLQEGSKEPVQTQGNRAPGRSDDETNEE
jgi:hypothetical protein